MKFAPFLPEPLPGWTADAIQVERRPATQQVKRAYRQGGGDGIVTVGIGTSRVIPTGKPSEMIAADPGLRQMQAKAEPINGREALVMTFGPQWMATLSIKGSFGIIASGFAAAAPDKGRGHVLEYLRKLDFARIAAAK